MLLNKLLSALCAVVLLLFGSMTLAGYSPEGENSSARQRRGDDRKVSDTIRNETDVEKTFEDEKSPDDEIRDETPEENNAYFRNNAPEFYYYSRMNEDGRQLYDMMVDLMYHPEIDGMVVEKDISISPSTPEFDDLYHKVREAVEYDHPELFWYFAQDAYPFRLTSYTEPNSAGYYRVSMTLSQPFENFETIMTQFNDAADAFLAEIDRMETPAQIALSIHDKLIDMVSYDYETAEKGLRGYAHSAYGALVDNGRGTAHNAVCDGYTKAYIYLLQQSGIISCEIIGNAGSETLGLHAWTCVLLDGEWYEVDATWDDTEPEHDFADYPDDVAVILENTEFMDTCRHAYFLLTTDELTDFTVTDDRYTITAGSMIYYIHLDSRHVRVTAAEGWPIADDFPVANGTQYSYDSLRN